ncbi:ABC transporter ATP-binding protein [Lichenicola sp.]|uniref:ABC transporter ATP-binding protein n=1 Tax=Lichenicola sp. TaxID=2804529 RepID=UPI003AFF990B
MTALDIVGVAKSFGDVAVLADLDLQVAPGSLVAILGASGGGKTTLLRLICGFDRPDAGSIVIAGRPVSGPGLHVRPEHRRIGYVAQDGALFPHLSVGQNILFGLDRTGRRDQARAEALLELVGLPATYAMRPPQALSGGEQQRVALARALAPRPGLVLLDEPFSALDAALRAGTRRAVAEALSRAGATALLVTHDQSEALSMGDQVGVLRRGRLVQIAAPAELYRNPVDAELARFVGEAVLLPGHAQDGGVECALGHLVLAPGTLQAGPVQVMVRPEQIVLGAALSDGADARVVSVAYYGHDASLGLMLPTLDAPLVARINGAQALSLHEGDLVRIAVNGPVVAFRTG